MLWSISGNRKFRNLHPDTIIRHLETRVSLWWYCYHSDGTSQTNVELNWTMTQLSKPIRKKMLEAADKLCLVNVCHFDVFFSANARNILRLLIIMQYVFAIKTEFFDEVVSSASIINSYASQWCQIKVCFGLSTMGWCAPNQLVKFLGVCFSLVHFGEEWSLRLEHQSRSSSAQHGTWHFPLHIYHSFIRCQPLS